MENLWKVLYNEVTNQKERYGLMQHYPISTSIHLYFDPTFRISVGEQIRRITHCGFRHLDFNFLDWHASAESPFVGENWKALIEEAGLAAEAEGADFNQAHAPVFDGLWFTGDYDFRRQIQIRAIEACSMLGIPWMVFHEMVMPDCHTMEDNIEYYKGLLPYCHKYNVGMAIENQWPIYTDRIGARTDRLVELVDTLNDPLVGICCDTGHGNLIGMSHYAWRPDRNTELAACADQYVQLKKIGSRLKAMHIDDNNGMDDDHIAPFEGTVNWRDVMRALRDIGYEHSFTYEAHNAIRKYPEHLKDEKARLLYRIAETLVSWDGEGNFEPPLN